MSTAKLEIRNARKAFEGKAVLNDVDLEVGHHDVICLIGASGSGKSTLLKCVNLLYPLDGGQIFLDGDEITAPGVNPNHVRQRMGIVFQAFNLFPHMSVLDNITLSPRKVHGTDRATAESRARELLDEVRSR